MSFIKHVFYNFSVKKILSSVLILSFLVPVVFLTIPPVKSTALLITDGIVVEPGVEWHFFLVEEGINLTDIAFATDVTAGATVDIALLTDTVLAPDSAAESVHQFWLKAFAWAFAKLIVKDITAQTVNWINSGFKGNPAFITNPEQFFTDVGDRTVIQALNDKGGLLNKICTPFRPQIRLALVQNYLQQGQAQQCSIQGIIKNYEAFVNDFSQGGWEGWFSMTQNAQNNPYGSYLQAQSELELSIANQDNKYQKQLDWGQGFLSYQKCVKTVPVADQTFIIDNPDNAGTDLEGTPENQSSINLLTGGGCAKEETVTPGSVINSQLEKTLGSSIDQLNLVNDINQIVSALMVQGIKGIFGGITNGLRGLSSKQQDQNSSLVSQLMKGSPAAIAECNDVVSSTQAGVPSTIAPAIGQAATASGCSASLAPSVDTTATTNQVNADIANLQTQKAFLNLNAAP